MIKLRKLKPLIRESRYSAKKQTLWIRWWAFRFSSILPSGVTFRISYNYPVSHIISCHEITKFLLFLGPPHCTILGNYILLVNSFSLYHIGSTWDFSPETLPEETLFQIERLQFSNTILLYFFCISLKDLSNFTLIEKINRGEIIWMLTI